MNKIIIKNGEFEKIYEKSEFDWLDVVFNGDSNIISIDMTHSKAKKINITCSNDCFISIGYGMKINKSLSLVCGDRAICKIGNNFDCGSTDIRLTGEKNLSCSIGNECLFGISISIRASDGHAIYDVETKKLLNKGSEIIIGNHVWCCRNVTILKNVTIPSDTIVGLGSVVINKNFHSYSIIAGIPAQTVRNNVNWNKCSPDKLDKLLK